jgi:acyl carrier protein
METNTVPDMASISTTIKALVAEVAGQPPDTIDDATGLDAIGIDSLMVVEVVVGIQRRLGVQVPPSEFRADIRTVGDLTRSLGTYVHAQLGA